MATINICIANLGKYNEGILACEWLELPVSDNGLEEVLDNIGINEFYEEYFICDYECDFMEIEEYDSINGLNDIAYRIQGLDSNNENILKGLLDHGLDIDEAMEYIDGGYDMMVYYNCDDMEDIARYYIDEYYTLPEEIKYYFDYEAYGNAMKSNGTYVFCDGSIIVQLF